MMPGDDVLHLDIAPSLYIGFQMGPHLRGHQVLE
jgi:hypothetical protein